MSIDTIIRAWTDPEFRSRLSADDLARLPDSPVGTVVEPSWMSAKVAPTTCTSNLSVCRYTTRCC